MDTYKSSVEKVFNNDLIVTMIFDRMKTMRDIYALHSVLKKSNSISYNDNFLQRYIKSRPNLYKEFWAYGNVYNRSYVYIDADTTEIYRDTTLDWSLIPAVEWQNKKSIPVVSSDVFVEFKRQSKLWSSLNYSVVPINIYRNPEVSNMIRWDLYTPHMEYDKESMIKFQFEIFWSKVNYKKLLLRTTDISFFMEVKERIDWTRLSRTKIPWDPEFLFTFKDVIKWSLIDYDYLPNIIFFGGGFEDVLIPEQCMFTRYIGPPNDYMNSCMKDEYSITSLYIYNYHIKKLNARARGEKDEFTKYYIPLRCAENVIDTDTVVEYKDCEQYPELFPYIDWSEKLKYKFFERRMYITLRDFFTREQWEIISSNHVIMNSFNINELGTLKEYIDWSRASQVLYPTTQLIERFRNYLDFRVMSTMGMTYVTRALYMKYLCKKPQPNVYNVQVDYNWFCNMYFSDN